MKRWRYSEKPGDLSAQHTVVDDASDTGSVLGGDAGRRPVGFVLDHPLEEHDPAHHVWFDSNTDATCASSAEASTTCTRLAMT